MGRIAAWAMLSIATASWVVRSAFDFMRMAPGMSPGSFPSWGDYVWWSLVDPMYVFPHLLGVWLLAKARGLGGGAFRWRWWLGGSLAILLLPALSITLFLFFAFGPSSAIPGGTLLLILAQVLPIWPIWRLVTERHARRLRKGVAGL